MAERRLPDAQQAHGLIQQAIAAGQAGQWSAAAQRLRAALLAPTAQAIAAQGLLECAAQMTRQGLSAPAMPLIGAPASGLLSVVVCSIDPQRLACLRTNLQQHLSDPHWELIVIPDARSLCEGYARGLQRARGELVVLCHDDIGIVGDRFEPRLRAYLQRFDLIGVAGSTRLDGPKWFWAGPPHTYSWVSQPHTNGSFVVGLLGADGPTIAGAQALYGLFLAGRRDALLQLGFDAARFDGFHFYDLDLSWRAHQAGLKTAIALDLLVWHASGGNFADSWQHYAARFLEKFPALQPQYAAAAFRPGTLIVPQAEAIAPIFGWIAHWLASEPAYA